MFGYVVMNKPEIKFKDFDLYRSFYCGLCRELKDRYGISGQISLTYDMTFVVILLSALYVFARYIHICAYQLRSQTLFVFLNMRKSPSASDARRQRDHHRLALLVVHRFLLVSVFQCFGISVFR